MTKATLVLSSTCSAGSALALCFRPGPLLHRSALDPCSALASCFAGSALAPCSASVPGLSTSTWTWPSFLLLFPCDSHTTQTVSCHPGVHFTSSIALITHTAAANHTHFIAMDFLFLIAEYCLAFIALLVIATLRSQFPVLVSNSKSSHVVLPYCLSPDLLPVLDFPLVLLFGLCLYLAWIIWLLDYPFASPSGLCSPSFDPCLSLDYSFVLPVLYLCCCLTLACIDHVWK